MFTIRDAVENKGGAPVTLFPYGQVVRHGKPATLGYYVLHEGLVGNLGEQGLQEFTYDHVDKEPLLSPGTNGKVWKDAVGGFLGITDKYWAAAVIPDQARKYEGRYSSVQTGTMPHLSGRFPRRGRHRRARRQRCRRARVSSPAPRKSRRSTATRRTSASSASSC